MLTSPPQKTTLAWGACLHDNHVVIAKKTQPLHGCDGDTTNETQSCCRKVDAKTLHRTMLKWQAFKSVLLSSVVMIYNWDTTMVINIYKPSQVGYNPNKTMISSSNHLLTGDAKLHQYRPGDSGWFASFFPRSSFATLPPACPTCWWQFWRPSLLSLKWQHGPPLSQVVWMDPSKLSPPIFAPK